VEVSAAGSNNFGLTQQQVKQLIRLLSSASNASSSHSNLWLILVIDYIEAVDEVFLASGLNLHRVLAVLVFLVKPYLCS